VICLLNELASHRSIISILWLVSAWCCKIVTTPYFGVLHTGMRCEYVHVFWCLICWVLLWQRVVIAASHCWWTGMLADIWWWTKSTATSPVTYCHRIHRSNTFQIQTFATRHNQSGTGLSWVTGTRHYRMSYCTRRSTTSSFDWTAPPWTTCARSVDAWKNTTPMWPTSCVTTGKIFYSKWLETVPTIHTEVKELTTDAE